MGYLGSGKNAALSYQTMRIELFRDYDVMDADPIIASALDIYSDESTVHNEYDEILTISSTNSDIKEVLHNLFYDVLNIEFNMWPWTRNLVKYGDFFLYLEISEKYGIHNVLPMSVYETTRVEGSDPHNPYLVKFMTTGQSFPKTEFENFEIAHFRLLSDSNFLPYGKSMIESARRVWKQVTLLEDAMLIHRITRAPEKRIFKLDVGNIPPNEVPTFMAKAIDSMKKAPLLDTKTGDYNLKYNMQNIIEDFYLPVRGKDSGTNIDSLKGLEFNAVEDIEYVQKRLFAALKIPKAFLGYEQDVNGKATLAAQDVRFSRTIERIQRIIVSELTKIAIVHLYSQGYNDEDLVNFELSLTNPSTVAEQEKLNLWKEKIELAKSIKEVHLISDEWIYKNVFELSEDESTKEKKQIIQNVKDAFRVKSIEEQGSDPAKTPPAHEENAAAGPGAPEDEGGRPKEPTAFDHDEGTQGRDPLGKKENQKALKVGQQRKDTRPPALARESRVVQQYGLEGMNRSTVPNLISEDFKPSMERDERGTYLDEAVLDDDGSEK
jgi:hypothetical protein